MKRGGYREGAGRPLGSVNKSSLKSHLELAEKIKMNADEIINILMDVAQNSSNDSARISACNSLLSRGYGKFPIVKECSETEMPTKIILVGTSPSKLIADE